MGKSRGEVLKAYRKRVLFTRHALDQMNRPERMISQEEVRWVIESGEMIEDYPDDPRGHSCLMSGTGEDGRVIHTVVAPQKDYLAVITAYLPNPEEWQPGFKKRR